MQRLRQEASAVPSVTMRQGVVKQLLDGGLSPSNCYEHWQHEVMRTKSSVGLCRFMTLPVHDAAMQIA